ncbi:Moulting cycle domain containing protein [Trichuris trichiura]|uniref:Moulting cycle domain containing protein n=1 Tax=Trichuris trichiura TaxID=36087 RepID=A0A077YXY6_TRITR|nr:Moulting cycle domain containing protein [Trichuris trichiura]
MNLNELVFQNLLRNEEMGNILNFHPLMQQLVITVLLFFVGETRENFPRFPLNDQTRPLIEEMRYKTVMGNLLATVATRIGRRIKNDSRLIELCVCVHETKTVSDYAKCLTPLLNKRRRKRSEENRSSSERVFAVISYFLQLARKLLFGESTNSRKRLKDSSRAASTSKPPSANGQSRYGKMFHQFWDSIDRAINERNLSKLLPDSPLPLWLEKKVRDVRELMDEMKQSDILPSLRLLSPRIMAMNPIDGSVTRILSPDLINLYDRDMARSATLQRLIDEVSIWPKLIRNMINKVKRRSSTVGPLNYLKKTQKKLSELDESLSDAQLKTIKDKGYAFLRDDQLELLYDKQSLPVQPALYSRMNEQEKEEALEEYIIKLASESNEREKRNVQVGNAVLLRAFISTSTVNEPSILGPLILSPLFSSPVVLSPQLLSPSIVSPAFASALVLSPLLLSPLILSPQILSPFVLSPILLSPFILSPMIVAPSVLSPMALNPILANPSIVSLNLLSPMTHCPSIMSPQILVATVLSPSAYSPSINSSCTGCLVQILECYENMTDEEKENELQAAIADFANKDLKESGNVEPKVSSSLRGVLLTPLVQAVTVGSPSVLGFIILSPGVFSPLILSPPLLATTIMSPLVMSPAILTPITLNPIILNPIILNPFILSPLFLSPVILTPLVMTPLIFFPTVLSPIMFVPGVMNLRILSPRFLSPLIFSSQTLYASILSPTYLSPLVETNCTLIYNDRISDQVLNWYKRLTEEDKELLLKKAIVAIAQGKQASLLERQAQVPEEVAGLLLSPVINTPQVGEPSVLGFIILSPLVYSPATLSPALFTPTILSPVVFSPAIVSPIAISPVFLSPLFISPYILTPTILTPIILAPMVLTPLILVPKVLTPLILQPGILSPDILCPRTLSPSILSSHALFAAILSPRYMSPYIRSNCSACAFIGSPCIMC